MTINLYLNLKKQLINSYSPYSKFKTAAVVSTDKGLFYGTNVENVSFGLTICAERNAIFNAISHGAKKFKSLSLISSSKKNNIVPCGSCLQVMSEFFNKNILITVYSYNGDIKKYKLNDLLPCSFKDFRK